MARHHDQTQAGCPFINLNDARCARHFTLRHLADAFDLCISDPQGCPTYHQLQRDRGRPSVQVTVAGREPFIAPRRLAG